MPIIEADNVWKRFRIPHRRRSTILDQIASVLSIFEGERFSYEDLWALRELNLNLEYGESLGVIGPNGSGKSTLLKLLAGVMKPDKGTVKTTGSIAPVLELGIGFHGDLTVKENALIYGVIMGLPRKEMKKRIASIIDFADLARFQDAKLKTLSTGMAVRLAFSIAIQSQASIYLVDEALAVGDIEFQQKCLDKFRDFKKDKKSIVLASHNLDLVRSFCEKTIYLLNGETRAFGGSDDAVGRYLEDMKSASEVSISTHRLL